MNLPSKAVSYEDSVISKFPLLLRELSRVDGGLSPLSLYYAVKEGFRDIAEFIEALDCLYALGNVDFDDEKGVLRRVN